MLLPYKVWAVAATSHSRPEHEDHSPDVDKRQDLFSLIRIPSISALPEHHDDMLACAQRWAQLLLEAGVDEACLLYTSTR